jgi:hypothetical protein
VLPGNPRHICTFVCREGVTKILFGLKAFQVLIW